MKVCKTQAEKGLRRPLVPPSIINRKSCFLLSVGLFLLTGMPVYAQSPGGVTGAKVWLKANAGTSTTTQGVVVSDWNDQSGNANNAAYNSSPYFGNGGSHPTASNIVTYQQTGINFNPSLRFPGTTGSNYGILQGPISGSLSTNNISSYVVFRMNGSTPLHGNVANLYGGGGDITNINNAALLTRVGSTTINVVSRRLGYDGSGLVFDSKDLGPAIGPAAALAATHFTTNNLWKMELNGVTGTSTYTTTAFTSPNYRLGIGAYDGTDWLNGDIAEFILYPSDQTASGNNNIRIESYLALKYGIHKAGNYVNSAGTVFWDSAANALYHHDVFGIGQDDGSGLTQTQSNAANTGSGDGTGVSGQGNLVLSNPSAMADGKFLMIGHTDRDVSFLIGGVPAGLYARTDRTWKVQTTGGGVGTVTLQFDLTGTGLPQTEINNLRLLIDATGTGNFAVATATAPSAVSGNIVTYNNVTLNNGVVFAFATQTAINMPAAPGGISAGVKLWLKGDAGVTFSGGTNVNGWTDQTNRGSNATFPLTTMKFSGAPPAAPTIQPTYQTNGMNFHPVVRFNGTGSSSFSALQGNLVGGSGVVYNDNVSAYVVSNRHGNAGGAARAFLINQSDSTSDFQDVYSVIFQSKNFGISNLTNIMSQNNANAISPVGNMYYPMLNSAHMTGSQLKTETNGSAFGTVASTGALYASIYRLGVAMDGPNNCGNGEYYLPMTRRLWQIISMIK
jgi:hypothetical protein